MLDGMGAEFSRPVVPSESRYRSCDVSDVIVIIGGYFVSRSLISLTF